MILETIAGSAMGIFGTFLTTYSNYKMELLKMEAKKNEQAYNLARIKAESDASIAEVQANIKIAETITQGAVDVEEAKAFAASQASQKQSLPSEWLDILFNMKGRARFITYPLGLTLLLLFGISDWIQNTMRSALTIYSLAIASWATYKTYGMIYNHVDRLAPILNALEIWQDTVSLLLMLAVTLVTWWFGDRRMAKHLMHMKGK